MSRLPCITTLAPSCMHNWSPDAAWLVYTGGRVMTEGQLRTWTSTASGPTAAGPNSA